MVTQNKKSFRFSYNDIENRLYSYDTISLIAIAEDIKPAGYYHKFSKNELVLLLHTLYNILEGKKNNTILHLKEHARLLGIPGYFRIDPNDIKGS